MKKLKQIVGILALTGFLTFSNVPVIAQDTDRVTTTSTMDDDMDDDDKDYGWIGLLGLAGLAGLLKRDRHVHTDTDRRSTTGPNTGTTNR